ncbi:hypothetical protein BDC45DRAFT_566844 [Circinella umbellata]|nr:hypothetical protein BDC45DRAFT_566844 [Circinella umbellata]
MPTIRIIDGDESNEEELQTNDQSLCNICQKQFANYVCPRCNLRYCSLGCYKDIQHADCTESFYKDSITEEIRSRGTSEEDKQNMLQLLRRFEAENDQQATKLGTDEDEDEEEEDLHERFANIDLDNADEDAIWALLSEEERKEFESLLQHHHENGDDSSIPLPEYHPWWKEENNGFNKKVKIIMQDDDDEEEERNAIPKLPTPLPDLEAMMKPKSPPGLESDLIWSLMHTTMVYCYVMRHFLGDIREEVKDTLFVVSKLSKSTLFSSTPGYAYGNPTEVLYDLVNDILDYEEEDSESNNMSRRTGLMLVLLDDSLSVLEKQDAVIRAMGDLWELLEAGTKKVDKTARKSCFLAARKAYFYLAYAVYISKNHGLERMKLLAMAERERLLLEEQAFDRQRKIAEQAIEMQQKQNKPKITDVL